jgi:hypothetical protein
MSFADSIEGQREEEGLGNIADSDAFYVTFKKGEGSVDSQLFDQALGYILSSLLGAKPVTSGGNPYTHTFTLSQTNQPVTLSLYWKDPDRSYMFALTPSYTTLGSKFLQQHLQFRVASTIGALSAETAIKNLELNISRNTIFDNNLGTVEPTDIYAQELSVSGSIQLYLNDDTFRNLMLANTYQAMEIKFLASTSSSLQLQFPRTDWSEWQPDYNLKNIAQQKINFKANYDAANALDIISTAVLVNTKVSY